MCVLCLLIASSLGIGLFLCVQVDVLAGIADPCPVILVCRQAVEDKTTLTVPLFLQFLPTPEMSKVWRARRLLVNNPPSLLFPSPVETSPQAALTSRKLWYDVCACISVPVCVCVFECRCLCLCAS